MANAGGSCSIVGQSRIPLHVLAFGPTFTQLSARAPVAPALKYKFPPWSLSLSTPFQLSSKLHTTHNGLSRYPLAPEALRRCRQWRRRRWPASPRQDCLPLRTYTHPPCPCSFPGLVPPVPPPISARAQPAAAAAIPFVFPLNESALCCNRKRR